NKSTNLKAVMSLAASFTNGRTLCLIASERYVGGSLSRTSQRLTVLTSTSRISASCFCVYLALALRSKFSVSGCCICGIPSRYLSGHYVRFYSLLQVHAVYLFSAALTPQKPARLRVRRRRREVV